MKIVFGLSRGKRILQIKVKSGSIHNFVVKYFYRMSAQHKSCALICAFVIWNVLGTKM